MSANWIMRWSSTSAWAIMETSEILAILVIPVRPAIPATVAVATTATATHSKIYFDGGRAFYPGSNPGDDRHGTAATFEAARAAFEAAWRDYLPKRSEADFEEWRQDAAWHEAKFARWDARK
jgi:hypothetical protein